MNLLIVDDEFYIVQGIINALNREALGIDQVFSAYSARQAREIIRKETVDLMITDIEMPREDGLSLIEWTQVQGRSITTLILTGHQRFDYAQKAIMMHCFGYILKPVDQRSLECELKNAIKSRSKAGTTATPLPIPAPVTNADHFVEKVRSFISSNIGSPNLNRDMVAGYLHINPDYLSSLFHAKFNQTLSSYIAVARIDKAKEMLKNSSLSLNEISEKTGFSNTSYFHKQFKKITGMTPQQYRYGR